jgi:hypothetical protein
MCAPGWRMMADKPTTFWLRLHEGNHLRHRSRSESHVHTFAQLLASYASGNDGRIAGRALVALK